MSDGFWISQENIPVTDPWEDLGDPVQLGTPQHCIPEFGWFFWTRTHSVWPLLRSPVGDPPSESRLQLTVQVDTCGVSESSSYGQLRNIVCADQIKPIELQAGELDHDPPYNIDLSTLYNTAFSPTGTTWPFIRSPSGEEGWYCTEHEFPLLKRYLIPLLRVVGFPGWWLKLTFSGQVPNCTFAPGDEEAEIFKLRFALRHTLSWDHYIDEINGDQSLWQKVGDDFCQNQNVGPFYVWIPIYWCDQVVDAWEPYWEDDAYFVAPGQIYGEPYSQFWNWHEAFTLSIVAAQLIGP